MAERKSLLVVEDSMEGYLKGRVMLREVLEGQGK